MLHGVRWGKPVHSAPPPERAKIILQELSNPALPTAPK